MNTHKNNEKIIRLLSDSEPLCGETEEEKAHREAMTKESEKNIIEDDPLEFPKKVAGAVCIGIWGFSVLALISGFGELGVLVPFILFSLASVCGLNIPGFVKKGKIGDIIISVIACGVCVLIAVGMLTHN